MKFNLGELEKLFKDISDIIDYVKNATLRNRRNTLFLSNGDNLTYCVPEFVIAHLLGVNINYLAATSIYKSHNSFELLKEMSEDPYKIYVNSTNKIISQEQLFSTHIKEKIASFKENIKINVNETEFVCKYDKNKSFYNSEINEDCDYIIVKKYEDSKIGVILLVKNSFLFVPMSNRIFENINEANNYLKELLAGQEITLLSGNNVYNIENEYEKKIILNPCYKREKFEALEEYKKTFNCSIDMSSDYKYMANKLLEKRDERFENNTTIDKLVSAIANGSTIDRRYYSDSMLLNIIDAWNNYLCTKPECNNTGAITYTEAIIKLEEAKELITKLTEENKDLNDKVIEVNNENEILKNENKEKTLIINKVFELIKPQNS